MSLQVTFDDEVAKAYVELVAANVPVTEIRDLTQRVSPKPAEGEVKRAAAPVEDE